MDFQYGIEYWDRMLRQNSSFAKQINEIRWNFVKPAKAKTVLDFGSGCGFFRAFKPEGIVVDTYDINPWPQTGIKSNYYDLITMWDVLEHIEYLDEFFKLEFLALGIADFKFLAITIPALPKGIELKLWKHYKPGEHFHYKTEEDWDNLFKNHDFKKINSGYPECPPRVDIYSALYERKI